MARRASAEPLLALLLAAMPAAALETLDETALADVSAQDGLLLELDSAAPISANQLTWYTDMGAAPAGSCTGGIANRQACTLLAPQLSGVGGNLRASLNLDVGGNGSQPAVAMDLSWQPLLLQTPQLTLNTPTADYSSRTLGQFGFHSAGHFRLANEGGLFNSSGNTARIDFLSQGDIIYRQGGAGSPELSFGNFLLGLRSSNGAAGGQLAANGRFGIDAQGLVFSAPYADFNLLFDLMFKSGASNYDTTGRSPIIQFGWTGGLVNPLIRLSPGGIAYGTHASTANHASGLSYDFFDHSYRDPVTGLGVGAARSEGLNIFASWDFDSDFAWVLGQAGGNRTQARFTSWRRMAGVPVTTPMLTMPITLDVLQNNQGPGGLGAGGLCFGSFTRGVPTAASCAAAGGSWVASNVPAGSAAFATLIRDGRLHAYNQKIEVVDPASPNPSTVYDWSLVYTFGKLDADIFLTPEGRNQGVAVSTNSSGIRADITLGIQSPGFWERANSASAAVRATAGANWSTNTHFMVADTNVNGTGQQYGVGLINADLLWFARNMYFRVVGSDTGYPDLPGGFWMQTDTGATYRFRGLLGGGNLLDLSAPTGIALLDINLSTSRFLFALHPRPAIAGDAPVGFSGLLDLDGNAFMSWGEVSSPSSAFRLYDVSGRIGWRNGNVNLVSGQNTADSRPMLSISNDLLFGSSANFGSGGGNPVVARAGFGSENFGRIALPGGTWNSDISLKIPNN